MRGDLLFYSDFPFGFHNTEAEEKMSRFAARGWTMPEVNKRQANVFRGQTTLKNERGTAPGRS